MSLRALQESIARWGRETFGHGDLPAPAMPIAARMNVEVAELLNGLAALQLLPPDAPERAAILDNLRAECADVGIMLVQVADALEGDLEAEMIAKMEINRARTWGRTASGKVQHVEVNPAEALRQAAVIVGAATGHEVDHASFDAAAERLARTAFKEEGSGLMMFPDLYYILSDSGSAYTGEGFPTAELAWAWAHSPAGVEAGADGAVVPTYLREEHRWDGQDGANIYLGADLADFWEHNPLPEDA